MQTYADILKNLYEDNWNITLIHPKEVPVDRPAAMHTCQWGSNTGSAASQPAVAFCSEPTVPQP